MDRRCKGRTCWQQTHSFGPWKNVTDVPGLAKVDERVCRLCGKVERDVRMEARDER